MKGAKKVGEWTQAFRLIPGDMIWSPPDHGFRLLVKSKNVKDALELSWLSRSGRLTSYSVSKHDEDMTFFRITD